MPVSSVLYIITGTIGQDESCVYQYVQQPDTDLGCNPIGSPLQLHCAITGPKDPVFRLQWYSSSPGGQVQLLPSGIMKQGSTVSSFLRTMVNSLDIGTCFWCELTIQGAGPFVRSNELCLEDSELEQCSLDELVVVNMTETCVASVSVIDPSIATSSTIVASTMFGSEAPALATTAHNTLLLTSHSASPVTMSTRQTKPAATPSSIFISLKESSFVQDSSLLVMSTMASQTTDVMETVPRASFEGALAAAVVVCVLFVAVIVTLVVLIVCLTKKNWSWFTICKNPGSCCIKSSQQLEG